MTIVTTTAICLLAIFAFLFGRSAVISTRRQNLLNKTKDERDKLSRSLDKIENSSKYDRHFEIEEDDSNSTCRVFMKVYVRKSTYAGEHIESICYCLIKNSLMKMTRTSHGAKRRNFLTKSTRNENN